MILILLLRKEFHELGFVYVMVSLIDSSKVTS
jgi:hypothetical protein